MTKNTLGNILQGRTIFIEHSENECGGKLKSIYLQLGRLFLVYQ